MEIGAKHVCDCLKISGCGAIQQKKKVKNSTNNTIKKVLIVR